MKKFLFVLALMAFGTTFSFAQNTPVAKTEQPVKVKKAKKVKKNAAETAKTTYECPMKCEPATDHAGQCGKCKMDLVAVKAKKK